MGTRWFLIEEVSEGLRIFIKDLLNNLGYKNVSERI
ncbi:hypothetical protein HKBW3S34_02068 [Candidatus Hakubella thermalkaliphila]|uniref:Uncharacterized protein n=1 Tax=Candidatus Hakubella thermalkaliphila TaxID=2754717 RepID=A0A6V8PEJ3_9ACTN|nr:hypothetical protein HKBW3S34_02068 [Candidatus Hakubella thermalkaliphila]